MKKLVITLASVAALNAAPVWAEISYDQILLDPDNVELNRAYALERIKARDIKPALSAIERVIRANPLDLGARLIKAQILVYLGDFAIARSELEVLANLNLPEEQAATVADLLKQADESTSRTRVSGYVGFGVSNDDNVGGHTDTGLIADANGNTAGNTFTDAEGNTTKTSDTFTALRAGLNLVYDLGTQTQDELFISLRGSSSNGADTGLKDMKNVGLSVGANLNRAGYKTSLFASYDKTTKPTVSNDTSSTNLDDVSSTTVGASVSRAAGSTNIQATYTYSLTDYSGRGELSDISDSNTHKLNVNALHPLSSTVAIYGNVGYAVRRAENTNLVLAEARQDRNSLLTGVGLLVAPAPGHRVNLGLVANQHDYQERNAQQDQYVRDDRETSVSISYTVQGDALWKPLSGWSFGLNAARSKVDSNMATYDVTTNTYGLTANYSF